MLALSSRQPNQQKQHSEEAEVSEINRLLEGNIPSDAYVMNGERTDKKQPRRHSPAQRSEAAFHQQPTQATAASTRRPDSLMNLIKQRKNLQRGEPTRQPPNL